MHIGDVVRLTGLSRKTIRLYEEKGLLSVDREENFTPGALAAGVLYGMAKELYSMYEKMPHSHIRTLAASGNAIRKNPALVKALSEVFGMKVIIPAEKEEAAFGAAMTAAVGAGYIKDIKDIGKWIRYLTKEGRELL